MDGTCLSYLHPHACQTNMVNVKCLGDGGFGHHSKHRVGQIFPFLYDLL